MAQMSYRVAKRTQSTVSHFTTPIKESVGEEPPFINERIKSTIIKVQFNISFGH